MGCTLPKGRVAAQWGPMGLMGFNTPVRQSATHRGPVMFRVQDSGLRAYMPEDARCATSAGQRTVLSPSSAQQMMP